MRGGGHAVPATPEAAFTAADSEPTRGEAGWTAPPHRPRSRCACPGFTGTSLSSPGEAPGGGGGGGGNPRPAAARARRGRHAWGGACMTPSPARRRRAPGRPSPSGGAPSGAVGRPPARGPAQPRAAEHGPQIVFRRRRPVHTRRRLRPAAARAPASASPALCRSCRRHRPSSSSLCGTPPCPPARGSCACRRPGTCLPTCARPRW